MMHKKLCAISGCNFPEGECQELCWHPEERRMDVIGQNGNTGEHYPSKGSVRVVVIENGKVDLEYVAHWNGDRREILERAQRLLSLLIKESEK